MNTKLMLLAVMSLTYAGRVTAQSASRSFVGEWRADGSDPYGSGMTAVRIADSSGHWSIHVWGSCLPQACDWGERPLNMLSAGVESRQPIRGFATWEHGFATQHVIVRIDGEVLVAELYVFFRDSSGRPDYFRADRLVRGKVAG